GGGSQQGNNNNECGIAVHAAHYPTAALALSSLALTAGSGVGVKQPFEDVSEYLCSATDFIRWGASRFAEAGLHYGHGTDNALDEAVALVLHALHLPHGCPDRLLDARLTPAEKADIYRLIARRVDERMPAAYLTGEAWFAGMKFKADARALVP